MKTQEYISVFFTVLFSSLLNVMVCVISAFIFCGCSQSFFPGKYQEDKVEISLSPDVVKVFSEAGIRPEQWELSCVSSSGEKTILTSTSGKFTLKLNNDEVAVISIKPAGGEPSGLPDAAVPAVGAVYPFHCTVKDEWLKPSGSMEADFIKALAADAIKNILISGSYSENSLRTVRAFNWDKFDTHLRERKKPVPCPLLMDMEVFLKAFFEKNTNMYWKVKKKETNTVSVKIPGEKYAEPGRRIFLLQLYPEHLIAETAEGHDGGDFQVTAELPDGHWIFLSADEYGSADWFAVQVTKGQVQASYTADKLF